MQFIDLGAQQRMIRNNIETRIQKVLDHGKYINGPEIKELEEKLAEYVGVQFAVGVGSGTDALLMSLMANDIGPGDAIFTTVFTFIATAEVIQLLRAKPIFVDIDPSTYNIDPEKLELSIKDVIKRGTLKPKGIIPVDLFGQPANYDAINKIAKRYGLFVLEDAAQSFGKIPIDVKKMHIDAITINAHKIYGPKGVGALYLRDKNIIEPLLHGGGQEFGLRSSTENVPGIVGFAKAVELRKKEMRSEVKRLFKLKDQILMLL